MKLVQNRIKKDWQGWAIPGGHVEPGESFVESVIREVYEETGLTLTRWRYRGIVTFVSAPDAEAEYMHLFTATGFEGELKDCDEGVLEWLPKDKLYGLPMWAGDRIFLELLDKGAPFFSLKLVYEGERLVCAALDGKEINLSS